MPVQNITRTDGNWPALVAHLQRTGDARWVLDEEGQPLPDLHYLAIAAGESIIGSLTLKLQDIVSPETEWSIEHQHDRRLRDQDGRPYHETFVQTFSVEEAYRRQGHGTQLQRAALDLSRKLGAYQMRSWSSLDKPGNYALKLSLGFAAHPEIQEAAMTGQRISGMYFVKVVQPVEP